MGAAYTEQAVILIVDHNPGDVETIKDALENTAISSRVFSAIDTEDALKFLNRQDDHAHAPLPDLILLDLKIPDPGHTGLLRTLKTDARFLHIPVIILTASADEQDILKSYQQQANCYIVKPPNIMKFKKVIGVVSDFWLGIARLPRGQDF